MAFVTINCPKPDCNGVLVLGIDEYGSIFLPRPSPKVKDAVVKLACPVCQNDIVVGFEHVIRQ